MENRNYKISRDTVYVGEVVIPTDISRYNGDRPRFRTKPGELMAHSFYYLRSTLFIPTEDNFSDDLLYSAPHYPILNMTDDEIIFKLAAESIVIQEAYCLKEILKYIGCKEILTYRDIVRIRRLLFTGRFGMDHSELFGMKEHIPNYFEAHKFGKVVTDEAERLKRYRNTLTLGSERSFGNDSSNSIFPTELMYILDDRGNNSFSEIIFDGYPLDPFKPKKEEGHIIKLKPAIKWNQH